MRAGYTFTSGSRGGYYVTNHALLMLDNPTEYLNWSYRSENFVHDPLINMIHGVKGGKEFAIMPFPVCTPKPNFVATLK
jgi:hypothetical protein